MFVGGRGGGTRYLALLWKWPLLSGRVRCALPLAPPLEGLPVGAACGVGPLDGSRVVGFLTERAWSLFFSLPGGFWGGRGKVFLFLCAVSGVLASWWGFWLWFYLGMSF